MGHVVDRWTRPPRKGEGTKRVKGPRWGRGKRWLARWTTPDGRETSKACATKDEALAHLADVDTQLRSGTYVPDRGPTLSEYAERWLTSQLQQRDSTRGQARSRLELHVLPVIGHLPVGKVTRADVQRVVNEAALGADAKRVMFAWLRAVFNSAVEDRLVVVSPCRKIKLPAVESTVTDPLSVGQVVAIAAGMPGRLAGMVWLGAGSGLRPGELRGLTVDRVQGDRVVVDRQLVTGGAVPVWGPPKTASSRRTVALAPVTVGVLEAHLREYRRGPGGLVFASASGSGLTRSHLQYAWSRAAEGLGLGPRSGWHALRHHHASLLIAGGASPRAVADRLGHADPSETLRTYSHLWPTDEGRMVGAVQAAYSPHSVSGEGVGGVVADL